MSQEPGALTDADNLFSLYAVLLIDPRAQGAFPAVLLSVLKIAVVALMMTHL